LYARHGGEDDEPAICILVELPTLSELDVKAKEGAFIVPAAKEADTTPL
jgi:hypothetical protein